MKHRYFIYLTNKTSTFLVIVGKKLLHVYFFNSLVTNKICLVVNKLSNTINTMKIILDNHIPASVIVLVITFPFILFICGKTDAICRYLILEKHKKDRTLILSNDTFLFDRSNKIETVTKQSLSIK